MMDPAAITGMVLAGGRGSRMGHVDKGLQLLRGEPMAAHVLRRLAPQVGHIAINANRNQDAYCALGAPVWPDELPGFAGPLAGLATGLRRCATPLLLTVPCDSPFLPLDLATRLSTALALHGADLAVAETVEPAEPAPGEAPRVQLQPVFALVRRSALPQLSAYLATGGRRMDGWYGAVRVVRVRFEDSTFFRNINTPQELAEHDTSP
ncbi:MAG: molybdenum cofactor guanylyltransferase MobA [Gammaproteobacteria bacterium]